MNTNNFWGMSRSTGINVGLIVRVGLATLSLVGSLVLAWTLLSPQRGAYASPNTPSASSCYPLTNSGNCYEPGDYCRAADHGASGIAGDGEPITCIYNNGWRWEPSTTATRTPSPTTTTTSTPSPTTIATSTPSPTPTGTLPPNLPPGPVNSTWYFA